MAHCSPEKPWGIHPPVRNAEPCARCGWNAPGPSHGRKAIARAAELGWAVVQGGPPEERRQALAA